MASIRKRRWISGGTIREAWVCDYRDQAGERRFKQFARKKDADAWLVKARGEVASGTHTADSDSITVAEAAGLWLQRCAIDHLERSTIEQREQHVRLHIVPFIGSAKLSRLSAPRVQEFIDQLVAAGRSRAMARKVLTNLGAVVDEAHRRGLVAQNVARGIRFRMPKRDEVKVVPPTKPEIRAILAATEAPQFARLRPLVVTAVFTGMRSSELRGLLWGHVDFEARLIRVRQRADKWNTIGPPKSAAGSRDIPMAPIVVNVLREWKLSCAKGELGLVFPNSRGGVQSYPNLLRRGFLPLLEEAGLAGRFGLHDLRHAAASLFIEQPTFTPKRLQVLMGHTSVAMTFDTYGHLFPQPESDQETMAAIEAGLMRV